MSRTERGEEARERTMGAVLYSGTGRDDRTRKRVDGLAIEVMKQTKNVHDVSVHSVFSGPLRNEVRAVGTRGQLVRPESTFVQTPVPFCVHTSKQMHDPSVFCCKTKAVW